MAVNVVVNPSTLTWSNFRVVDSSPDLSDDEVAQIARALGDPNRLAIYTHIAQRDERMPGRPSGPIRTRRLVR